ncbi:MAG: DUF4625 domain-containing protein [Paludibacteraceae bacterium]|nr:DUF4625 domain-containing protein [Paludibacteraceae bacterium]
MRKNIFMSLSTALILTLPTACNNSVKDLTPPVISDTEFLPADCDIYYQGDTLTVRFSCMDDSELGNFNIEIHSNFDHHTHGTSAVDCNEDEEESNHQEKDAGHENEHEETKGGWIYNRDYAIPAGRQDYTAELQIPVPPDAVKGDYHFMLRLTDAAGWQSLKGVAIHIENARRAPAGSTSLQ